MQNIDFKNYVINTWKILKYTYGIFFILVGIDKFFNLITNQWPLYVSDIITTTTNVNGNIICYLVGVINISIGILILSKYTKQASMIGAVWILGIVINIIISGKYLDIATRAIVIALGAIVLSRITYIKNQISDKSRNKL